MASECTNFSRASSSARCALRAWKLETKTPAISTPAITPPTKSPRQLRRVNFDKR